MALRDDIKTFGAALNKIADDTIERGGDVLGLQKQIPKVDISTPPPGGVYPSGKVSNDADLKPTNVPAALPPPASQSPATANDSPSEINAAKRGTRIQTEGSDILPQSMNVATENISDVLPTADYLKDIRSGAKFLRASGVVGTGPGDAPLYNDKSLEFIEALPGRGAVTTFTDDPATIAAIKARREESSEPDMSIGWLISSMLKRRQQKSAMENLYSQANLQKILAETGAIPEKAAMEKAKNEAEIKHIGVQTKAIEDQTATLTQMLKSLPTDASSDTPDMTETRAWILGQLRSKLSPQSAGAEGGKKLIGRDKKTGKNVYQDEAGNKFLEG